MQQIFLKPNRDAPIRRGHPWIFSGAIERCEGDDQIVDVADIFDNKKNWLGRGLYNPKSQLRVRLLTWKKETIDRSFFRHPPGPSVGLSRRAVGRGQLTPTGWSTAKAIFSPV